MEDYFMCCIPLREDQKPTVIIKCGKLVGQLRETDQGVDYVSFTSIPYAEPPVGEMNQICATTINSIKPSTGHLRFRKPVPKEPWTNILNATKKCPHPLQSSSVTLGYIYF